MIVTTPGDTGQAALLERLDAEVAAAHRRSPADEVEICVLSRAGEYTRFAGDVVHQPQDITETQYLIRAVVDGHACRTATTAVGRLARFVDLAATAARDRARAAGTAGTTELAGPTDGDRVPGALVQDDTVAFDATARVAAARAAMTDAARVGGEAAGMFGRAITRQAVVNTRGLHRATTASEASGALTVDVGDGTAHWVDLGRSVGRLDVAGSVAAAIDQAARSRGRVELPPGSYPVVLGPEAMGELLQFLPDVGFSGELAASGIGLVAQRAGQQIAAPVVHVADDASLDIGLPIGFDLEGTSKARVPFLDAGRVASAVTDRATARRLGCASTGHAHIAREQVPAPQAANIVMAAGGSSEAALIGGVGRGVYVQRFWYTRLVDRTDGTITGVTRDACFLIEDGRLTHPLAGTRFTQSVVALLATVDAVGSDLRSQPVMNVWNGATSAPAVRARAFRFGAAPMPDDRQPHDRGGER